MQPIRQQLWLHISDDESSEEEILKQFQHQPQNTFKFNSRSKTMPKFFGSTQNTKASQQLTTFKSQNCDDKKQKQQFINSQVPQINQLRKIPPKPPQRKLIRSDPDGMQQQHLSVTAEFHEKKTFQLAVVQQTHKLALRENPKHQLININHIQQQQQHLLRQTHSSSSSSATATPTHFQQNSLIFGTQNSHFQPQQQQYQMFQSHKQQQLIYGSSKMPRMNVMSNNQHSHDLNSFGNRATVIATLDEEEDEKSDPENHIYEMIDESEASGQHKKKHHVNNAEQHDHNDLFQNLLRTEMMNQLQLCNNGSSLRGNNGFLSHLTHEKRMDIIQETALALASAAYVENSSRD